MTQPTNIEKEFHQKFSDRFLEIARLADEGDDVGYGQELAKLEIDIKDYFVETISKRDRIARQEERGNMKDIIEHLLKQYGINTPNMDALVLNRKEFLMLIDAELAQPQTLPSEDLTPNDKE